jgi:hypothetical protein
MVRYSIRAIAGAVLAGACLALAACSSSPSSHAGRTDGPVSHGTVTVREGTKVVCVMTVVSGKGTCKVLASEIGSVGAHTVVGEYSGAGYQSAKSQPVTVTVTSAPTAGP